jgi:hypothetical protein
MYQRGTKLKPLTLALQDLTGIRTVFLRRQTRRGGTHLLLVGTVEGLSIARLIHGADPARPETALARAARLVADIKNEVLVGSFEPPSTLAGVLHAAQAGVRKLERAELIRSSTAQSRFRWLRRGIDFCSGNNLPCNQLALTRWILQTGRGSRERRERITASKCLAQAAGFELDLSIEAKFSTKHAEHKRHSTFNEDLTVQALDLLCSRDYAAGWALSFCFCTGIRLRGALAINTDDLNCRLVIGSVIRYWDGKVGRQRQSEAIISTEPSWIDLRVFPPELTFAPWNRIANTHEHNQLEQLATKLLNRATTVVGTQRNLVAARHLRRLATRRLLIAGVHPLQVCSAVGTSLPILENHYSDLFTSEASKAVKACMAGPLL